MKEVVFLEGISIPMISHAINHDSLVRGVSRAKNGVIVKISWMMVLNL